MLPVLVVRVIVVLGGEGLDGGGGGRQGGDGGDRGDGDGQGGYRRWTPNVVPSARRARVPQPGPPDTARRNTGTLCASDGQRIEKLGPDYAHHPRAV